MLEYIAANPDCRLTVWATIEGIDQMLTQVDGPTDPGDHAGVKQILEPAPLTTAQGIESLLTGQPTACTVTLKVCDHEGWLRGLLTDATVTRLFAPVDRDDTTIQIHPWAGIAAPGVVYLGRERIEFDDYTLDGDHYTLTDCARATYSEGYAGKYPANDEGVFPVYPVGTTPGRLEGRYIRLFAMPLTPDGQFLFAQNDAQEIWRGVIDAVPVSVDGVLWDIQCKGLESLLNQQVRNENQGVAQLVSPVWEPGKGPLIVVQPGSVLRFRVRRSARDAMLGGYVDQTDWITVPLESGIYQAGWLTRLGEMMADAIRATNPLLWSEFVNDADVVWLLAVSDDGHTSMQIRGVTDHWPSPFVTDGVDDPLVYRYTFEFDESSDLAIRYGVHGQIGLSGTMLGPAFMSATFPVTYPDIPRFGPGVVIDWERSARPIKTHLINRHRDRLAVEFPLGIPWTRPGHLRVNDEVMEIVSLTLLDWATQTGAPVYELKVKRELTAPEPWTLEQGTAEDIDPPEFEPVVVVQGPDPFACAANLLMGLHEADANGPYSEAIGAGIYACHFDLGEFARLLEQPPITGGRRAVYDEAIRLQDWIGQNLALEEIAVVPGFVGTEYKLRPVRLSTAPAVTHQVRVDWQGAMRVQSGLGRVVNVVTVQQDRGKGVFRDLDSAAKYGVTRTQAYDLAQVSTVDGLSNIGAAAARLFALFGRPTILLSLPVPANGRTIEPGHGVIIETPNLPALYCVLSAQRSWIGGREHCLLQCQEVPALDAGYYAPVARATSVDGKTGTIGAAYCQGLNPWTGAASRAVDYFAVGDGVIVFDPDDQQDALTDTIAAIDLDLETITLTTNNWPAGHAITLRTRAFSTTQSAGRYIFVDGANQWI